MEENYKDSIILKRNVDSNENPIAIDKLDIKQVMDNHSCIVLEQLPDESYGLDINGFSEVYDSEHIGVNNYRVSYAHGVVYFNPVNVSKTIQIGYKGIGSEIIYCSRIASKLDRYGNVVETIEELIKKGKEYLDLIKTLGDSVVIINKLEQNIIIGSDLHTKLLEDIRVATPLQRDLHKDIADGNVLYPKLHKDVADGTVLEPKLKEAVTNANIIKPLLDQSLADARDDINTINSTGNFERTILPSEWVSNTDINNPALFKFNINHNMNSMYIHSTLRDSNKNAMPDISRVVDKMNVVIYSDERVEMNVVLSARYYKAAITISDDVAEEVVKARGTEVNLKARLDNHSSQLADIETQKAEKIVVDNLTSIVNSKPSLSDGTSNAMSTWSSIKIQQVISSIPKGEKGESGTASVAINDSVENNTQTWTSENIMKKTAIKNSVTPCFYWEGNVLKCTQGNIFGAKNRDYKIFNQQELDLNPFNNVLVYFDTSEENPLILKTLINIDSSNIDFYKNPNIVIVAYRNYSRKYCNFLDIEKVKIDNTHYKYILSENSLRIMNDKVVIYDNAFIIGAEKGFIKLTKNLVGHTVKPYSVLVANLETGTPVLEEWSWNGSGLQYNYETISKSKMLPLAYRDGNGKLTLYSKNDDLNRLTIRVEQLETGNSNSVWSDKKICWYGTSIPEGKANGIANGKSYPILIGEKLGANVINHALGSSPVRFGYKEKVTIEDKYGIFGENWKNVCFSLSATLSEKQDILNNWDFYKTKFTGSPPEVLEGTWLEIMNSSSYETKLLPHLGENKRADLYVFDHGYNDQLREYDINEPSNSKDRKTFVGAMNFLIDIIKRDNPYAKILIFGHYDNLEYDKVWKNQLNIANIWGLPIYKQWEKLGWSTQTIKTDGYWNSDIEWITSGGVEQTIKIKDIWMSDKVHPSSDKSGKALMKIVGNAVPFFNTIA